MLVIAFATACAGRYGGGAEPLAQPEPRARPAPATNASIDAAAENMRKAERPSWPRPDAPAEDNRLYDDDAIMALIDAIDPHEYERWPLTPNQHPSLEPAYAIANVFASPGVTWLDLCRMGAQNRRGAGNADQAEYLRAWCDVAKRDAAAAVARLRPLVNSSVLGMPAAVRTDIANIVVDGGDSTFAQDVLTRAQVDDLAVYDLAAAGYIEVGKVRDAIELGDRAIAAHDARRPADHCMRVARKIVLVDPGSRGPLIMGLDRLPRCEVQYRELLCWHEKHCDPFLLAHGIKPEQLKLGAVYKTWPKPGASTDEWVRAAEDARGSYALDSPLAVIRAVEAGLRSINCTGPRVAELTNSARLMAKWLSPQGAQPELRERLLVIASVPETACAPN